MTKAEKHRNEKLFNQRLQEKCGYEPQRVRACANCAHYIRHFVLTRNGSSLLLSPNNKGHCNKQDNTACDEAGLCESYKEDKVKMKESRTFVIFEYLLDGVGATSNMVTCIPLTAHVIRRIFALETAEQGDNPPYMRDGSAGCCYREGNDAGNNNVAEGGGVHK